jgi:hypothetical protein
MMGGRCNNPDGTCVPTELIQKKGASDEKPHAGDKAKGGLKQKKVPAANPTQGNEARKISGPVLVQLETDPDKKTLANVALYLILVDPAKHPMAQKLQMDKLPPRVLGTGLEVMTNGPFAAVIRYDQITKTNGKVCRVVLGDATYQVVVHEGTSVKQK